MIGANHIKILVKDMKLMVDFYQGVLGAELIDNIGEYACLSCGVSTIELHAGSEGDFQYVALELDTTDQMEELCQRLKKIVTVPMSAGFISDGKQRFSCELTDPENNKLHLTCQRLLVPIL